MTTFLIRRGKRAVRRRAVAHIGRFNQRGEMVGAWCGRGFDMQSNVPWGLRQCKDCLRRYWRDESVGSVVEGEPS